MKRTDEFARDTVRFTLAAAPRRAATLEAHRRGVVHALQQRLPP